jgi:Flp pilus assembly protein TadG
LTQAGDATANHRETALRSNRDEKGQSIVELAIVLVMLTMIAIAGTDFARGVSEYGQVVSAANAGAQYGATGTAESTNTSAIAAAASANLGSLYPQPGASITSATSDDGTGASQKQVTVTVTIPFHFVAPFANYFPDFNLTSTAVMRVNPYGT